MPRCQPHSDQKTLSACHQCLNGERGTSSRIVPQARHSEASAAVLARPLTVISLAPVTSVAVGEHKQVTDVASGGIVGR